MKETIQQLEKIIADYTRESGVRDLDRQLASIMRNLAKQYATKGKLKPTISAGDVTKILGKSRYSNEMYKTANMAGVAVGLAWTYDCLNGVLWSRQDHVDGCYCMLCVGCDMGLLLT